MVILLDLMELEEIFSKTEGIIHGIDAPNINLQNSARRGNVVFQKSPEIWRNATVDSNAISSSF